MNLETIDVVRVTKEEIADCGGADWKELIKAKPDRLATIQYGYNTRQPANKPDWVPPKDIHERELPYLPINTAWLRNVCGRAYLYSQNW